MKVDDKMKYFLKPLEVVVWIFISSGYIIYLRIPCETFFLNSHAVSLSGLKQLKKYEKILLNTSFSRD